MGKNKNFRKNFFARREGRKRPAANDRLTAVKAQAVRLAFVSSVSALRRGLPVGNGVSRSACFCGGSGSAWRRGLPVGNSSAGSALHPQGTSSLDPYGRKPSGLLLWVRFPPCGGDCLSAIVLRAPPCTRKGHRPLTQVGASCGLLLWGFGCAWRRG